MGDVSECKELKLFPGRHVSIMQSLHKVITFLMIRLLLTAYYYQGLIKIQWQNIELILPRQASK